MATAGLWEQYVGYVHIPMMFIILVLLSTHLISERLTKNVAHLFNAHAVVAGTKIRFIPLILFINFIWLANDLHKIKNLTREHASHDHRCHSQGAACLVELGLMKAQLTKFQRGAMMNLCSILLTFQVYLTSTAFENFKVAEENAKKASEPKKGFMGSLFGK